MDAGRLKGMLRPYPSDEMTCWPVSQRVNSVKNNDASLIEPISIVAGVAGVTRLVRIFFV